MITTTSIRLYPSATLACLAVGERARLLAPQFPQCSLSRGTSISWPQIRLVCILEYIENNLFQLNSTYTPDPCCIILQEVSVEAFSAILSHDWVRRCFTVVRTSREEWPHDAAYGNVTLVSITVYAEAAYSLVFGTSRMGRNAVLVDLQFVNPSGGQHLIMRIANTHLESLQAGTSLRPGQLDSISYLLKDHEVDGGVGGGDMNAIAPSDEWIHEDAGLADAYRGEPYGSQAFTWGYQPRTPFLPGRLDKFLYTPEVFGQPR